MISSLVEREKINLDDEIDVIMNCSIPSTHGKLINVNELLAHTYDSKLRKMAYNFITEDGALYTHAHTGKSIPIYSKGSQDRPSHTAYYVMLWNNMDCYSSKPFLFFSHQNEVTDKVNVLIKEKFKKYVIKIFEILEKVENTLKMKLRKYIMSDLPDNYHYPGWEFYKTTEPPESEYPGDIQRKPSVYKFSESYISSQLSMSKSNILKGIKPGSTDPRMSDEDKLLKYFADLELVNDPVEYNSQTGIGKLFNDVSDIRKEEILKKLRYDRFMPKWKKGMSRLSAFKEYIKQYPLPEKTIARQGGSRKRRKSICKNYNKKCKHYTKKHKIIHKKTKRQKYQKRK